MSLSEIQCSNLLKQLHVDINPLNRSSFEYQAILKYISNGLKQESNRYLIECVDILEATRVEDNFKKFPDRTRYDQSPLQPATSISTPQQPIKRQLGVSTLDSFVGPKRPLLWYGCVTSSVAAKLLNGVQVTNNKWTDYKAISLWDNVVGCCHNNGLLKFSGTYGDTNYNRSSNKGILMLYEVNYKIKKIPINAGIDNEKSTDYLEAQNNFNDDDDTDDENDDNNSSGNNRPKFVYCSDVQDDVNRDEILQVTGRFTPNPDENVMMGDLYMPSGNLEYSTNIKSNHNGWLNGFLRVWGNYNQYLITHHNMLKLKYLIVVNCRPNNNPNNNIGQSIPKQLKIQPQQPIISKSNNNNNQSNSSSSIWSNILVKKRSIQETINVDQDDIKSTSNNNEDDDDLTESDNDDNNQNDESKKSSQILKKQKK